MGSKEVIIVFSKQEVRDIVYDVLEELSVDIATIQDTQPLFQSNGRKAVLPFKTNLPTFCFSIEDRMGIDIDPDRDWKEETLGSFISGLIKGLIKKSS